MGPLKTLKVIEIAGIGPGPLAGRILADLGAQVIVVDRAVTPADPTDINRRGKRSIALDLKSAPGRVAAVRLISKCDVLIEGFRPGTMERLGIGPEAFRETNPRLIYARMTGWGQTGPLSATAGHDINYLSVTGGLHAIGSADHPIPPLNLLADYAGGTMFLLTGILAALFERERSGLGQVVDAAMVDGVPALMGIIHTLYARGEWSNGRERNLLDGGAPFYRCYATRDRKFISVGPLEPRFFAIFLRLAGLPKSALARQNDRAEWHLLAEEIATTIAKKTQAEWVAIFKGSDACVAPVLSFEEVSDHPHNRERGTFITRDGVLQAAPAPRFSRCRPVVPNTIEPPGSSGEAILTENGFSRQEITGLHLDGALK